MNILDLLNENLVIIDLKAKNKNDTISEMSNVLKQENVISDLDGFINDIHLRESQTTTGIGEGVAIPHAKSQFVNKTAILFAKSNSGLDYKSLDNKAVNLLFMLAVKEDATSEHVDILAKLSRLFLNDNFKKELLACNNPVEVISVIKKYDSSEESPNTTSNATSDSKNKKYFIVAVTACPTGIAHTFMAAEALEKAAKELKVDIKVETNGASGVGNKLDDTDIERAHGVILAINRKVPTNRFIGKQVIQVDAAKAIKDAKDLILSIIRKYGKVYKGDGTNIENGNEKTGGQLGKKSGSETYKHLMSGVSFMLPFVISGGMLIAFSFLFDKLAGVPAGVGLGNTTELAKLFSLVGSQAFALFVPVLAAFIAFSIADRAAITAGFVGGALASAGGSGFLGAIIAGFLAGYVTVLMIKLLKNLPNSLQGIKNILILPVLTVLITGVLLVLLFNTPVKYINDSILAWLNNLGDVNRVLLGLILGGMMAVDMGGPFNKAAYVFGVASLATGASETMAAVMAAGMTPPLGIAIASSIFKSKFTKEEREAGKSNYIMGLTFITEGAIPFAASNPLKVIPSLMIGSAVTGALSMFFRVNLPAPHGGIIVMFLSNHILLYALSILIGSLVTAFCLGILKPKPAQ